jgi:NAD(P)-dependent dehydrogenase (short-subunit alcohol dehydrogenase family)
MRLEGKTAVIIGAGQSPGEGMGNGRATVLKFAQEGCKVMAVDKDLKSAQETVGMVKKGGAECYAYQADVTKGETLKAAINDAYKRWGRIDILHYNVGVSLGGGDTTLLDFTEEIFDRICAINLRGAIMATKYVIPIMRQQKAGAISMISSLAVIENYLYVGYKVTKAGMNAFVKQTAIQNAEYGVRCNCVMPGLMDTPMAVGTRARLGVGGKSPAEVAAGRDARCPLRHKQGTAWDVANAVLFLDSDDASYVTGVEFLVDGGRSLLVGNFTQV